MLWDVHIYVGELSFLHLDGGVDEIEKINEVITNIRAIYNRGVPLFTKESIQNAANQRLAVEDRCHKVSTVALDGNMVNCDVETGRTFPAGG